MALRPRILLAITVYNGRAFVPRCLESARHIDRDRADIDVLVLDDASPEPGFSALVAEHCRRLSVHYYLTPRNLGIVRNVNLGMLAAVEQGYDFVIISNSDVVYSKQVVNELLEAYERDGRIGSVTAWSNNVSIYSIPNAAPDTYLASQDSVDWLAASLSGDFRGTAIDVPAGISFCILIPTKVIEDVGLMDPAFGRGYCEETDWSLRSLAHGYRSTLAPSAFVYHQGRGSTLAAGMLSGGHTTVPENEALIDYRYPLFRDQVDAFVRGGILEKLHRDAVLRIIRDAGRQFGYALTSAWSATEASQSQVQILYAPDGRPSSLRAVFRGFEAQFPAGFSSGSALRDFFGVGPSSTHVLALDERIPVNEEGQKRKTHASPSYPARV